MITKEIVIQRLTKEAFGEPLISNMYRGLVAEVLVDSVLSGDWKWCSSDWAAWDFEHGSGCRLEVKQSAAMQSWSDGSITKCIFGIAPSTGFFEGKVWKSDVGRKSSIYVFAHHDGVSVETDHREPAQWQFYVMPASRLPPASRSISLSSLIKLSQLVWEEIDGGRKFPCDLLGLHDAVEIVRERYFDTV